MKIKMVTGCCSEMFLGSKSLISLPHSYFSARTYTHVYKHIHVTYVWNRQNVLTRHSCVFIYIYICIYCVCRMFRSSCKRLRIVRGSEARGLTCCLWTRGNHEKLYHSRSGSFQLWTAVLDLDMKHILIACSHTARRGQIPLTEELQFSHVIKARSRCCKHHDIWL